MQGLNRQIRRMCEALGANVTHLRRVRIMNLRLGKLQPGQWRDLTPAELRALMAAQLDKAEMDMRKDKEKNAASQHPPGIQMGNDPAVCCSSS